MTTKPRPLYFTRVEGGQWEPFVEWQQPIVTVIHSVLFEDGSVFDSVNGWREDTVDVEKVRRAVGNIDA